MNAVNSELLALYKAERLREREQCIHAVLAEPDDETSWSWEVRQAVQQVKTRIIERMRRMP